MEYSDETKPLLQSNGILYVSKQEPVPEFPTLKLRHYIVVPVMFVYMGAYILALYVTNQYAYDYLKRREYPNKTLDNVTDQSLCEVNKSSDEYQDQLRVQQAASNWQIYFALAYGGPAIFSSIFLGSLTDSIGRKIPFLLPTFGSLVRVGVCTFGIYYEYDLAYFIIGYIVEGFSGGFAVILQCAFSYVADLTAPGKRRTIGIVVVEVAMGIATVSATFSSGYFIKATGFLYPMITSGGMILIIGFVVLLLLPETLSTKNKRHNRSFCVTIRTVFAFYFETDSGSPGARWQFNIAMLAFVFCTVPYLGRVGVETLYQLDSPFCWDPLQIGYFGAIRSVAQQTLGLGLLRVFHICMSDEGIAILGTLSSMAAFIVEAFAPSGTILYIVPVVGFGCSLPIPMIRTLMSRMTSADKQGAVFASIAAMEVVCHMVGNVIVNSVYSLTLDIMKGFVFLVVAGLYMISTILLVLLLALPRRSQSKTIEVEANQRR